MVEDHEMPIANLYSYRKRVAEGETPDVFVYDALPETLRVQIIHIWRDAIGEFKLRPGRGSENYIHNNEGWNFIHDTVAREHGVFKLADRP